MTDEITVRDVGIGDDDARERFETHAERLRSQVNYLLEEIEVRNELLDGMAHIHIRLPEGVKTAPSEVGEYAAANDLVLLSPSIEEGALAYKLTELDYWIKVGGAVRKEK